MSGQLALTKQLDVIANNLANMTTTGFRAERAVFEKALSKQQDLLAAPLHSENSLQAPLKTEEFVKFRGTYTDLTQGPIEKTGNPLDVAIEGKGFFVVQTPQGERYTRAGSFLRNSSNALTTMSGHKVAGNGGEITVQGNQISVTRDGTIMADGKVAGKLQVVDFKADQILHEEGTLFKAKDGAAPTVVNESNIVGGALEGSNVNAVQELAQMILASRLYESYGKVDDASSRMNSLRNQYLGTAS